MVMIYFDGGQKPIKGTRDLKTGLGVVVYHEGSTQGYAYNFVGVQDGAHEYAALFKAVALSIFLGFDYKEVSFVTDCKAVADIPHYLWEGNLRQGEADNFVRSHFPTATVGLIDGTLKVLKHININLVKSHSGVVHNEYADHLVKTALALEERCSRKYAQDHFDDWVLKPQRYWDTKTNAYAEKYFPFCSPIN